MPGHDIIMIGASAGGVEALSELVQLLPADLPAAIFMVLHVPSHAPSALPQILSRRSGLSVRHPRSGEPIAKGRIYIAPPDYHMLIEADRILLSRGPRENGHRPAIDPMFRSAARTFGPYVVGVVLSGTLADGTAGLQAIKMRGGVTIAQDPNEAMYAGMPTSAIEHVKIDYILPISGIAEAITRLAYEPIKEEELEPASNEMELETRMAEMDFERMPEDTHPGTPSVFGCPDCGGVLWEIQEGDVVRFRCRVGHAWSAENLLAEQTDSLEEALWTALRALDEQIALARRLEERYRERGFNHISERYSEKVRATMERADVIRNVLVNGSRSKEGEDLDIIPDDAPDEQADPVDLFPQKS